MAKNYNFRDFIGDIALGAGGRVPKYAAEGAQRPDLTGIRETEFKNSLEEPFKQALAQKRENDNTLAMLKFQEAVHNMEAKKEDMVADNELALRKQKHVEAQDKIKNRATARKIELQAESLKSDAAVLTMYKIAQNAAKVPEEDQTSEERQAVENLKVELQAKGYSFPDAAEDPSGWQKFIAFMDNTVGAKPLVTAKPTSVPAAKKPAKTTDTAGNAEWIKDAAGNWKKKGK